MRGDEENHFVENILAKGALTRGLAPVKKTSVRHWELYELTAENIEGPRPRLYRSNRTLADWRSELRERPAGTTLPIKFERSGAVREVMLTLADRVPPVR
jgi:hypothetical protein